VTRAQRLSTRTRFHAVRSSGIDARGATVRIRALHNGDHCSRAGIAVYGSRSAVVRNRARRRIRAALSPELARHPGLDVVVSAAAARAATVPFLELATDLGATMEAVWRRSRPGTP
jgi:ribonuclease P protein component